MAFIKDAKAEKLAQQAAQAYANGQMVFAVMLNTPTFNMGLSGEITDWSGMIEAVERQGFFLAHWAASVDSHGKPQAYPVFRRRQ